MRNSLNVNKLLLSIGMLFCIFGPAEAAIPDWPNGSGDAASFAISADDTLNINSNTFINGPVHVKVLRGAGGCTTLTIKLGTDPIILTGKKDLGNPVLYLETEQDCVIKWEVNKDLVFRGAGTGETLFIPCRGLNGVPGEHGGTVLFDICGGHQVSFTRNGSIERGGATHIYNVMDVFSGEIVNTILFRRCICDRSPSLNKHIFVNIGPESLMGYAAGEMITGSSCFAGTEKGIIKFDPSNWGASLSNTGRMFLNIEDTGAFIISGRYTPNPNKSDLQLADIDRKIPAGCQAVMSVVNMSEITHGTLGHAGLVVVNKNTKQFEFLADPWTNLGVRTDDIDPKYIGLFSGIQYGYVLGAEGVLDIGQDAYVMYVGQTLDVCPEAITLPCDESMVEQPCLANLCCGDCTPTLLCDLPPEQLIKKRNWSAFIVDGYLHPNARPAVIKFANFSALYFLSGVDCMGAVPHPVVDVNPLLESHPFAIDPSKPTPCVGNMVLDVEGFLFVQGAGTVRCDNPNKMEILSIEVGYTGGSVLIDPCSGEHDLFPERTFNTFMNQYRRYNTAYFFFNNCVQLCDHWLVHTDVNHKIYEKDDANSEPAYVGGETFTLVPPMPPYAIPRPTVSFSNSHFFVHSDVALTGVDFLIPNALHCPCVETCIESPESFLDEPCPEDTCPIREYLPRPRLNAVYRSGFRSRAGCGVCGPDYNNQYCNICILTGATECVNNESTFRFFYNGYHLDRGTGRQMILGTYIGSTACDCCTVISPDAHLDVMQYTQLSDCSPIPDHELRLQVEPNDKTIVKDIGDTTITGQNSGHTLYLGHATNISIGTHWPQTCPPFDEKTYPMFIIDGNFFSFETRGGCTNSPETSDVTGQGGIFVDTNGKISIGSCYRANMSVMVTQSDNGAIDLPRPRVFFDTRVGAAAWKLDLNDPDQRIIVDSGNLISDYTINWMNTIKDRYFLPYTTGGCSLCDCLPVDSMNLIGLPEVKGTIEQLQVKESRLFDPIHLLVNGGWIRELVFLSGFNSQEAPAGVIVLQDNGRVGLGSAHRNVDSLEASVKLGLNGVVIVANGDGRITLNEDIIIDDVCAFLPGPDPTPSDNFTLSIDSECCRELRVKRDGVIDLSAFGPNATIDFTGNVKVVLEPGAHVVLGGCTLAISEDAQFVCEPSDKITFGNTLSALDNYRVRFCGEGRVLIRGHGKFIVNRNAFAGVETLPVCEVYTTDLTFELQNSGAFLIGDGSDPYGGAFQVGDTQNYENETTPSISFTLHINGPEAIFAIAPQGFFGLGVGIVKKEEKAPDFWEVDATWNLATRPVVASPPDITAITINIDEGVFQHNQVYIGSDTQSSLVAIGPSRPTALGSEVIFNLDFLPVDDRETNVSQTTIRGGGNFVLINPNGSPVNPIVDDVESNTSGILASKPIFRTNQTGITGAASDLFNYWKNADVVGTTIQFNTRADVGPGVRNQVRLGYIDQTYIKRVTWIPVIGDGGVKTSQAYSINIGAVAIRLPSLDDTPAPRDPYSVLELS